MPLNKNNNKSLLDEIADSGTRSGIIYKKRLWIIEFGYRIAMIVAGILTYPMRKLQSALGYGDEIILIARREFNEL